MNRQAQVNSANSRAKKYNAIGRITLLQWENLLREKNHRCATCGISGDLSLDHIIPLFQGGGNNIENIQPLCIPCHQSQNVGRPLIYDQPMKARTYSLSDEDAVFIAKNGGSPYLRQLIQAEMTKQQETTQ